MSRLRRSPRSYSDHLQALQHFSGEPARKQRRNRDTRLPCVHQHFQCAAPLRAKRNPRHDRVMAVRTCRGAVSGLRPHRTPSARAKRANPVRTNATHAVKAARQKTRPYPSSTRTSSATAAAVIVPSSGPSVIIGTTVPSSRTRKTSAIISVRVAPVAPIATATHPGRATLHRAALASAIRVLNPVTAVSESVLECDSGLDGNHNSQCRQERPKITQIHAQQRAKTGQHHSPSPQVDRKVIVGARS